MHWCSKVTKSNSYCCPHSECIHVTASKEKMHHHEHKVENLVRHHSPKDCTEVRLPMLHLYQLRGKKSDMSRYAALKKLK